MTIEEFHPSRGESVEQRLRHLEDWAARISQTGAKEGSVAAAAGGNSLAGMIPERQVIWDALQGHDHEGTVSRAVPMTGDVTGTNTASEVVGIWTFPISSPTTWPFYNLQVKPNLARTAGIGWQYALNVTCLGAWRVADISTLGAADAEILNAWTGTTLPVYCPARVAVSSFAVAFPGTVGGGGNDLIVTVYVGGAATSLSLSTATIGATTGGWTTGIAVPIPMNSGTDFLTVKAKKTGVLAAIPALVTVWGSVY